MTDRIRKALEDMQVGSCGVKWDFMVWRVAGGFIVGENAVAREGFVHDLESCVDWFTWKLRVDKYANLPA